MRAIEKYKLLVMYREKHPAENGHMHHVIPRCMKPKANKTVSLTQQEHALAHYWLWHHYNTRGSHYDKQLAIHMRAAFIGLRKPCFRSRYRCTLEKEWRAYAEHVEKQLKKEAQA